MAIKIEHDLNIEADARRKAGIDIAEELAWHAAGCLKRYGAESEQACECEKQLAQRRDERTTAEPT